MNARALVRKFRRLFLIDMAFGAFSLGILHLAAFLGRKLTEARQGKGLTRSVWGITPILTLRLKAECDRMLGWESESLVFTSYFITHKFDINLKNIVYYGNAILGPNFHRLILAWALLRYDVFNYFQDQGILLPEGRSVPELELSFIKKAGKKLFFYTYGADCRTRSATLALGKFNLCGECTEPKKHCICDDDDQKKKIDIYSKYATALVAAGDMRSYVHKHYDMYFWPIDVSKSIPSPQPNHTDELKIAHAPNHTMFKGSRFLEKAVNELRDEGLKISLVRKSQVSNDKIMSLFDECDVIADQFIAGAYGYTTLEGLSRGKPVLCYLRDHTQILEPNRAPIINCNPDNLKQTLRWLSENSEKLKELAQYGRPYIQKYHSVEAVAARLGHMYLKLGNFNEQTNTIIRSNLTRLESNLKKIQTPEVPLELFPREGSPSLLLNESANNFSEAQA